MAANSLAVILIAVGLFNLVTNILGFVVSAEDENAALKIIFGVLLIIVGLIIRFRHRLAPAAERRMKSLAEAKNKRER